MSCMHDAQCSSPELYNGKYALWFVPTRWTQNTFELELSMLELIVKLFFCSENANAEIRLDATATHCSILHGRWTNNITFVVGKMDSDSDDNDGSSSEAASLSGSGSESEASLHESNSSSNDDDSVEQFNVNLQRVRENEFNVNLQRITVNDPEATELAGNGHYSCIEHMTDEGWEQLGRDISNNTHLKDVYL